MEEKKKTHWLGNAKTISRRDGSTFLVASICVEDLEAVPDKHRFKSKNGKSYIKVVISEYITGKNEWNNTHSLSLDTWQPSEEKIEDNKPEF